MTREMKTYFIQMRQDYCGEIEAESESAAQEDFEEACHHGMYYDGLYSIEIEESGEVRYLCDDCDSEVDEGVDLCECCADDEEE
tara:strand:- start:318 stop:569 length:252 start_codon:yes stop_codon:yes gene_type:complete